MAQVPRIQPFDVGGHYQNIGKAAGDLATKPVEGYFRGKEIGAKAQQAGLEAEKTQFELEDYSRKLEEAESSKEALNEVKETTVRLLLGDEGYFAITGSKKAPQAFEKTEKGGREQFDLGVKIEKGEFSPTAPDTAKMVETGGVLKNDIPYEQSLLIVRDINNAKSAKEVKAIMGAVGRYVQTQQEMKKEYPGMKLDTFQANQLQTKEDKQGNVSAAYGDDYDKRAREIGVPAFLKNEAKTAIQDYLAKNPKNPNEQEALQAVLGSKFGSKISANQNLRNSIKDMFLSELDREKVEIQKMGKEKQIMSDGIKWLDRRENTLADNARLSDNPGDIIENNMERMLAGDARERSPMGVPQAQKLINDLKADQKKEGDPLLKKLSAEYIQSEYGDHSEDSYDEAILDNGGNLPGFKNYGEFLKQTKKKRPVPKKGLGEKVVDVGGKVVDKVKDVLGAGEEPKHTNPETGKPLEVGEMVRGKKYLGGDPKKPESWQ